MKEKDREFTLEEMGILIKEITLGMRQKHTVKINTPEKKAVYKSLVKEIEEAKAKGYEIQGDQEFFGGGDLDW